MFTNKDKPELYELLKMNRSKLGKTPAQEKDEPAVSAPVVTTSDSEPIPYTAPPSSTTRPYPKLRMPFPTLKPKEPAGVFKKPKPIRPKTREEGKPLNYPKIIIIGGIIIAIIVIIYLALTLPQATPSTPGRTTSPSVQAPEIPAMMPATTGRTWAIRLIYYNNDADGSRAIITMCQMLRNKNIKVVTKSEMIHGISSNSIYLESKYSSQEQAQKELKNELPKLKNVHYKLKNASVVKLEEGR
ncbi:MAG: hypothetical protein HZA49_05690 [Planctomycetes bacterium]|nr:hypothetical protein [Planctomycetota bacterium]